MKRARYALLLVLLLLMLASIISLYASNTTHISRCYGSSSQGSLKQGVPLALSGDNFKSYTLLGNVLRRTYVHSTVKTIVEKTYQRIARTHPDYIFQYGETGFPSGGRFKPHRTHQNGLSVDFMVPVTRQGKPVSLPTYAWNQFGYAIHFNQAYRYQDYAIDFDALAIHLQTLHQVASEEGVSIRRVFLDPLMQSKLFATESGAYIQRHLPLSKNRQWVRHDNHYHVDFSLRCEP